LRAAHKLIDSVAFITNPGDTAHTLRLLERAIARDDAITRRRAFIFKPDRRRQESRRSDGGRRQGRLARERSMTDRARMTLDDLPVAARRKLGLRKERQSQFSKDAVRSHALRVLAEIAALTQDQRRRVLEHAVKVNAI
jgi:hypothetical protein